LRRGAAPEAAGDEPRWRRGAKAAVIGGSVGLGAVGALLLGLWQAQDQIRRGGEERRQAVQQMLVEVSRELRDLEGACPRLSVHTVGQVARLRTLQGSPAVTPQDEQTLGLLLGEVAQACRRRAESPDACPGAGSAVEQLLCAEATKPAAETDALNYWDPPQRPPGAARGLADVGALVHDSVAGAWARFNAWAFARGHADAEASPAPAAPPPDSCRIARAQACEGITVYMQIYDESARERAERLRADFKGYRMAPIENVNRSAEARQQRRPVPWQQPTFIAHDAAARACAAEMEKALNDNACWPREAERPAWITDLPGSLRARPATLELWLPTPPQDRAASLRY
ncbi:hypothetical protein, partial [Ottowia sp.]|uniref:hypothetical protein n=1 Tax=Ottowia sp. TaxID=1898956 RepID=UPI0039E5214A